MTDVKTFTLAEVREKEREAYRKACCFHAGMSVADGDRLAREAIPDPEPERRWVDAGGTDYARAADGRWWVRSIDGTPQPSWLSDKAVLALASLLPRVPVTVTEELILKANDTYMLHALPGVNLSYPGLRAALTAVAADLAQPAVACQHKAQWWAVVDKDGGDISAGRDREASEKWRKRWDRDYPEASPHRVVALAEVEDNR